MSSNDSTISIAIELSTALWLVATRLPGVAKSRMHRIAAGNTAALLALVNDLRARPSMGPVKLPSLLAASRRGETASGCIAC
jgi:hypothetical protein